MGMGGAGVALTQGPLASYWNPAALGHDGENAYGLAIPFSVHAALTGDAIAGANDLSDVQDACEASNGTPNSVCSQANITAALTKLGHPTNGLRADAGAGANLKIGKFAVFLNGYLDAGAVPRVDLFHTSPSTGVANSVNNNTSALIVKGANIGELGVGYGHELPFAPGLFLGGNFKIMNAKVGYTNYRIVTNNNDQSDILGKLKDTSVKSSNVGFDASALWDVERSFADAWWQPRVGLIGRNLNNPKFDQPAAAAADGVTGKFAVNPQVRMGVAISPFHWWNIAADLDMTNNITPVDGVKSRQLGIGTEVNVFNRTWINIPLRFGIARNLSTGSNMLSLGGGLNFLHVIVEASGQVSNKRIDTQTTGDSKRVPQEFGASVALSLLFGGSEDRPDTSRPSRVNIQPVPTQQIQTVTPPPAQTMQPAPTPEQVKANADKAQKDLDKEAAKPANKP